MPVRDHQGLVLDKFNGLWNRGDIDTTPIDHFSDCNNIRFFGNSFKTRDGIGISQNVSVPLFNIKRIYNYATQTANTLLVLTWDGTTGKIYHVVSPTLTYGPILTIVGMSDFAFVPYAGRAFISPFTQTSPTLNPPAALVATIANGAGIEVGVHQYASSFVTSAGTTLPSIITSITTAAVIANPVVTPVITDIGVGGGGSNLVPGATYKWLFTYTIGALETNIGPASLGFVAPTITHNIGLEASIAIPAGVGINIYRTLANGSTYYLEFSIIPANVPNLPIVGSGGYFTVGNQGDSSLVLQPVAPSSNTTQAQKVNLSSIPIDSSGVANARQIWRTAAGGTQLKSLTAILDNTTTVFVDTTPDASLGANAPTVSTATLGTGLIDLGLSGQFLYIYAGDGTAARKAAGSGMTGTMIVANGAGGHTDPGLHIFGFVTQTKSGYNSPPTILTQFVTSAGQSVSFGSVPTSGDPTITKRLLVATKAISVFNGNLDGYQFFFVPNGVINDNVSTFLNNISFYDADLLADASSLLNNYTSIPAGAVLSIYHNRLCVAATATDISLMLVSQPGQPEAISQITGLIVVPLDGNSITNAQEMRDVLYVFKRAKTVAYADNGGDPSSWPTTTIDNALGTSVHGIATVLDSGSSSIDSLIVATYQGISLFNGKFIIPELTWKIESLWKALDRTKFDLIQIVNAPIQKEIWLVLPTRNMLVGNYANGMDSRNIRWSPWSSVMPVNSVAIQNISDIILGMNLT